MLAKLAFSLLIALCHEDGNVLSSTMTNTYDALSRLSSQTRPMSQITYSYLAGANGTTTGLVSSVTHSKVGSNSFSPITFGYAYDELGYITSYTQTGKQDVTYNYDVQGQLTSVSDPNQDLYYSYEYDTYGNIRSAEAHGSYHTSDDYTNDYEYNNPKWLDLLTGFNDELIIYEGQSIVNGEIVGDPTSGNPISYFNGTRWEFVWQNGRQLASASTTDGDTTIDIDYTYDINGLRTSKTITRTTTTEEEDDGHTHTYTTTVVEPTCTEDGYTLYECECGYSYTDNVVDATGHTYTSTVTAPTCLNAGYTTYTCTCGDSYTDNVVDALGHNYMESETETGSVFTCSRCGDSYTGHQHTYTESVVAPTCTMRGYTVYTCSCGDTYMGNYVPALGHDGVEVGRTQTMITYMCNRCGATYQEPIVVDPNPPVEMSLRRSTVSVETEHHEYVYASGQLLREVITTTDEDGNVTTETLDFTYDASGSPYTLTRTVGTTSITYYYVVNPQGDVIRLVSANGATVAEYAYDPYGRVISATGTMAEVNPLRYRGYCYDAETEFYYLQSRYYDPTICRFINSDSYTSTGQNFLGQNMFAYCLNNPILGYDPTGELSLFAKIAITVGVVALCLTGVGAIAAGVATVAGATATAVTAAATTAVVSAGVSTVAGAIDGGICAEKCGGDFGDGAMAGAMGSATGALVAKIVCPKGGEFGYAANGLGRAVGSTVYNLTYEWFDTGSISTSNLGYYAVDAMLDATLSTCCYYYTGMMSNDIAAAAINGVVDGGVDIVQTVGFPASPGYNPNLSTPVRFENLVM